MTQDNEKNTAINYVNRQVSTGEDLIESLTLNHATNTPRRRRRLYMRLMMHVKNFMDGMVSKQVVIVPGLRGLGKTTTLAQVYMALKKTHGRQVNLLYFPLDEAQSRVKSGLPAILEAYEELLGGSFESLTKHTFIFIDEVQAGSTWPEQIKYLVGRSKKIFVICSGSSATQIQLIGDADLEGRRAFTEKLFPMNFVEQQILSGRELPIPGLKANLVGALYQQNNANEVYQLLKQLTPSVSTMWHRYPLSAIRPYLLTGGFPHMLDETEGTVIYHSVRNMVDRIIEKDIQAIGRFRPESVTILKRMVYVLAENDSISLQKLGDAIGEKSRAQVNNMIDAFQSAELIHKVPAYGSHIDAVKLPSRYLFMAPAIRASLFDIVGSSSTDQTRQGLLLEDYVGLQIYREFKSKGLGSLTHPYSKKGGLSDFILRIGNSNQVAIEVGLGRKDFGQVEETMKKHDCSYGLVLHNGPLDINKANTVVKVPLSYHFLI